ncbi:VCBS repeat-containing protein [Candidatus Sumerlaeota bacterium]|nr:VCBS repeat-containing protein [Candidatus Sumerlaeota bacterium]
MKQRQSCHHKGTKDTRARRIPGIRLGRIVSWWFVSLIALITLPSASNAAAADAAFVLQVLPSERSDEAIAWHDVNGDGRADFIRQADRRMEVYLMGERHNLARQPSWTIDIAPPWDLWDFADVRPDQRGEELLALSPQGVGWMSFSQRTTSTARMNMLIATPLPVVADQYQATPGNLAIQLSKGHPADLLLPGRDAMRIWRRQQDGKQWAVADEVRAPLGPLMLFRADFSRRWLIGRDFPMFSPRPPAASTDSPGRLSSREFRFSSWWASSAGGFVDWNCDGRLDWIASGSQSPGGLRILLQKGDGKFDHDHPLSVKLPSPTPAGREPKRRFINVPSQADAGDGWSREPALSVLDDLADINHDGRLDLVRLSSSRYWFEPRTDMTVFLQRADATFADRPDSTLHVRAISPTPALPLADLDGDGDLDLLLLRLDLQIGSLHSHVKSFLGKGLECYLGAYLWQDGSAYGRRPAWEKLILIGHDLFELEGDTHLLIQFDRDVTGDGRPDLVLCTNRNTICVFPLVDAKSGFAREPATTLKAPFSIEAIECNDVDGDGRNDIFVQGRESRDRSEPAQSPNRRERARRAGTKRAVFFAERD